MEKPYVVGIDIGGQTSKIGVVDARGNVLVQTAIRSDNHTEAIPFIDDLSKAVVDLVNQVSSMDHIRGIGIGAPNANYYNGKIYKAVNLKWAKDDEIPFAAYLSERLGVPVVLTNDANAAAMGEMTYGAARGMRNFIMITLGTGVGSGIVINGEVVYGYDGFAGELGHVTVVRENGRLCGCGRKGCLEAYASATGVARTAKEILESTNRDSLLRELPVDKIASKDVYEAAVKGDEVAKEIFEYTGKILGQACADFVAFSAPEAIVMFGGLTRAGDFIMKPTIDNLNESVFPHWRNKVKVIKSDLKESDAAILGASALAW